MITAKEYLEMQRFRARITLLVAIPIALGLGVLEYFVFKPVAMEYIIPELTELHWTLDISIVVGVVLAVLYFLYKYWQLHEMIEFFSAHPHELQEMLDKDFNYRR